MPHDEFVPNIPEGLVEALRRWFTDKPPAASLAHLPEYNPLYRAGVEEVIARIEDHFLTQKE